MANFGSRLREIRSKNKLTQKEFSKIFKLSESAIGMYERDEREPSFKLVNEIAEHFNITIDYLMGKADYSSNDITNEQKEVMHYGMITQEAEGGRELGNRIRTLRKSKKMTQQDLANKLNLAKSTISQYENGVNEPDNNTLRGIADIFCTSTDYLLGRINDPSPHVSLEKDDAEFEKFVNNPEHGNFFREYLEAPEERKKELMHFWRIIQEAERGRKLGDKQRDKK